MKTNRSPKIALAVVALAALAFASTASAQYKPVGDDGIAASPKVRQMLNERKASATPAVAVVPAMTRRNLRFHRHLSRLLSSPLLACPLLPASGLLPRRSPM